MKKHKGKPSKIQNSISYIYIYTYAYVCMLSCFNRVQLFVIIWTIVCQVPLAMEFSRQEYWNGFPCPPPGDLPNPGIEPMCLKPPALAGALPLVPPGKPDNLDYIYPMLHGF